MKSLRASLYIVLPIILTAALGGCATSTPEEARAPAPARELNRADAIASARQDASRNYGAGWDAPIDAHYHAGYWVVELQSASGYRLHYAISARDGSIRERSMVQ